MELAVRERRLADMWLSRRRIAGVVAGVAAACGAISACGAPSGDEGGGKGGATASASPTKMGPRGLGGKLFDGIWTFDDHTLTVDGEEVHAPENASPWMEFRDDGTVAGNYGCTPFRVKAELKATTLTLGDELPALPPPTATPAPPDEATSCPPPEKKSPELSNFEAKFKKFFHRGQLKITEKKFEQYSAASPPTSPQLRNEHGDVATLEIVRSPDIFETTFQLYQWMEYDHAEPLRSVKDTAFVFHRDGTVTGNLGCNDFTAKVYFNGSHLFFRDARLTTHRTCAAQNMADEKFVLETLQRSLNYFYAGTGGGIYMRDDVGSEYRATGLQFRPATDTDQ
ncbi:META domain-containing protein [Streptomyces sp. NBRC 110611]|uniref:META domain-containing protein n=1 Tax=Streptomyces sp. NBRC 110611 TaxID=1621259 RepID=UPI0015EFB7E0|nr:META domain-containing protein [Streptomyces sp. NBRC 110611]